MEKRAELWYNRVNFNYRGDAMELGEKIKKARLEAGLSQRQLCGDAITRNMLSLIENGTAKPSMKTLAFLAEQLGKPMGYFLADSGDTELLEELRKLRQAEEALAQGRHRLASALLESVQGNGLLRQKLLLQAKIPGENREEICAQLPDLDEELFLRATVAYAQGKWSRCLHLLEAMEARNSQWNLLRGRLCVVQKQYEEAASYLLRAEERLEVFELLEQCYRELGDYKQAYAYAVKQKN